MTNKDLLKQYANTGAILPDYQVSGLPKNILYSYLRRRILQAQQGEDNYNLSEYEFKSLPPKLLYKYLNGNVKLSYDEFFYIGPTQRTFYSNNIFYRDSFYGMEDYEIAFLGKKEITGLLDKLLRMGMDKKAEIIKSYWDVVHDENNQDLLRERLRKYLFLRPFEWILVSEELFREEVKWMVDNENISIKSLPEKFRRIFAEEKLNRGKVIYETEFRYLPPDLLNQYLTHRITQDFMNIAEWNIWQMSEEHVKLYVGKIKEHFLKTRQLPKISLVFKHLYPEAYKELTAFVEEVVRSYKNR